MRRRGPRLSAARTPCPSCRRETRTSTDGFCAECWQDKTDEGRPAFRIPPRTEGMFDDLELDPAWWWLAPAVGGIVVLIALRVLF